MKTTSKKPVHFIRINEDYFRSQSPKSFEKLVRRRIRNRDEPVVVELNVTLYTKRSIYKQLKYLACLTQLPIHGISFKNSHIIEMDMHEYFLGISRVFANWKKYLTYLDLNILYQS